MNYRELFDVEKDLIFLNSGSVSAVPREVLNAAERHRREYERNPTQALFSTWERLWAVQKRVAAHFGARPQDLFFRSNVTHAMNAFILGVELPSGEILATDQEYGAIVNACRMRVERDTAFDQGRGASTGAHRTFRQFQLPYGVEFAQNPDPKAWVDAIVAELKPETRMLVVSHVMTSTGYVIPLKELARETRRRGVLLAVDGAHACGAVPLDLSKLDDVDFYGGNLHKWMMGPKGTGLGWCPERIQSRVRPIEGHWTAFETPEPFQAFGGGSRFAASMLMSSCIDFATFYALNELIDFWERLGQPSVFAYRKSLRDHLAAEMSQKLDWPLVTPRASDRYPDVEGPLQTYALPVSLGSQGYHWMWSLLEKHRLQIVVNRIRDRWHVRFSPAIQNTLDEVSRAVEILSKL